MMVTVKKRIAAGGIFFAVLMFCVLSARAEVVDRVVAVVNDDIITSSELDAAVSMESSALKGGVHPDRMVDFKSAVLDSLVEDKLMKQHAEKIGIEVSDKEIDNAIDDVKKNNGLTQEKLILALTQSGVTYKEYREQMREDIRKSKFTDKMFRSQITVTDDDVHDFYLQNITDMAEGEEYRLRLLLISGIAGKDATAKKLDIIKAEMKKGTAFDVIIKTYSDGPGIETGGDIGFLDRENMDAALAEVAGILRPGEISGPVEVSSDVFIIQLLEKRPKKVRAYEEVKAALKAKLYGKLMQQKYIAWIEEMKRISYIDIRL